MKKWIIWVIVVILVIAAGGCWYYYFHAPSKKSSAKKTKLSPLDSTLSSLLVRIQDLEEQVPHVDTVYRVIKIDGTFEMTLDKASFEAIENCCEECND